MSAINPATKSENQTLTDKEQVFLERYLTHWNGARAAREAGYADPNSSMGFTASYEILRKPYIKRAIAERMYTMCMEANEALSRLAAIARQDITEFMDQDEYGEWHINMDKIIASGKGYLIKSFVPNRLGDPVVEFYSATDALDKLCKYLGLYKPEEANINISLSAWSEFVQQAKKTGEPIPGSPEYLNATNEDADAPDAE